jgi:hypothetical protein
MKGVCMGWIHGENNELRFGKHTLVEFGTTQSNDDSS